MANSYDVNEINRSKERVLRIGIIGCGEIVQVAHIPNINFLSHLFQTTYLCDISAQALAHCSKKVQGAPPRTTTDPEALCSSDNVDVVLIANADAYHVEHALIALKHDKWCLVEKPLSVCFRDVDKIIEAEKSSRGKLFVGTMRRFAAAFKDAVQEVGGMDRILYARVRDIIGPNSVSVDQSGTFPQKFNDFSDADTRDRLMREDDISQTALGSEFGVPITPESQRMLRFLGGLGTHDLSAMREILGMPQRVAGAMLTFPGIFSVIFDYGKFPCTYESGRVNIPEFDAHIEVYSPDKIVRVEFDTPYVKGLPTVMIVREKVGDGGFQERKIRKTYEDAYTLEFKEFYRCVVEDATPKTSAADAMNDIELFRMILKAGVDIYRKQGKELARMLYSKNAKVYIAARSQDKAYKAMDEIKRAYPSSKGGLAFLRLDLSDLSKIKASANEFLASEKKLDVLFNNAGVQNPLPEPSKTAQGYEYHLGVNTIGTFMFTKLLTPILVSTAKTEGAARVVWVSSSGTEFVGEKSVCIDMDNLDYHNDKPYLVKYGISKAGNWLHGVEFAKRYKADGVISIPLNPGNLASDLYREQKGLFKLFIWMVTYPPVNGAYTLLYAGLSPDITLEKTGSWVVPFGRTLPIRKDLIEATKTGAEGGNGTGKKFWEWTEEQIKAYV
ncbi:hypothetical protein AAE478_004977 [Parahypoxylon ruwenzoriense]